MPEKSSGKGNKGKKKNRFDLASDWKSARSSNHEVRAGKNPDWRKSKIKGGTLPKGIGCYSLGASNKNDPHGELSSEEDTTKAQSPPPAGMFREQELVTPNSPGEGGGF